MTQFDYEERTEAHAINNLETFSFPHLVMVERLSRFKLVFALFNRLFNIVCISLSPSESPIIRLNKLHLNRFVNKRSLLRT